MTLAGIDAEETCLGVLEDGAGAVVTRPFESIRLIAQLQEPVGVSATGT